MGLIDDMKSKAKDFADKKSNDHSSSQSDESHRSYIEHLKDKADQNGDDKLDMSDANKMKDKFSK